jgi:hypothetical protein
MNHMALHKLSEALGATLGPFLLCLFRGVIEQLEEGKVDFEVDKDFGKECRTRNLISARLIY